MPLVVSSRWAASATGWGTGPWVVRKKRPPPIRAAITMSLVTIQTFWTTAARFTPVRATAVIPPISSAAATVSLREPVSPTMSGKRMCIREAQNLAIEAMAPVDWTHRTTQAKTKASGRPKAARR